MINVFALGGRRIGPNEPPFILAEMSGNHNGDLDRALAIVDAVADAGAHGVKLQTYTADTITIDHDGPGFVIEEGLWAGRRLYELYAEAHTPWDWIGPIMERAAARSLVCFSSVFDGSAIAAMEALGAPAYKIASFEIVDLPLIAACAATGKPLIISTGMASLTEIAAAVDAARGAGARDILLTYCTSGYPTPPAEANLATIDHLAQAFGLPVGLSDHTAGIGVAAAASAMGARLIEKHVTLRRADGGPDAAFSLEPHELRALVEASAAAAVAVGGVHYGRSDSEAATIGLRRSLYVVADMAAGDAFTPENLRSIRPGGGLPPAALPQVLHRRAAVGIPRGTPLSWPLVGAS